MSRHRREPYFWSRTMIISMVAFLTGLGIYFHAIVTELTQSVPKPGPVATAPYRPPAPSAPQKPAQPHPAPTPTYTVKAGDNLWTITQTFNKSSRKSATTDSPSKPSNGTVTAPSSTGTPVSAHSASGNLTWQGVCHLNKIRNCNLIYPGQILKL